MKALEEMKREDMVFSGVVEDLENDDCPDCNGKLVRISERFNFLFLIGMISCSDRYESKGHPFSYWAEMWPNANYPYIRGIGDYKKSIEQLRDSFKFSDPRIKTCYARGSLEAHGMIESNRIVLAEEAGISYTPMRGPEPDFVHG